MAGATAAKTSRKSPHPKAKAEYKRKLKEAMSQLPEEERAEINNQYQSAAKKIQQATSRAQAQWTWEWIRDVIEEIEGRDDDSVVSEAEQ